MKAVVGVGFMKYCLAGVEIFAKLKFPSSEAVLVHSVESVLPDGGFLPASATNPIADIQRQRQKDGEKRMAEVATVLSKFGIPSQSVTAFGNPAHEITDVADLNVRKTALGEVQEDGQPGLIFDIRVPGQPFPALPNYSSSTSDVTAGRRIRYTIDVLNQGPSDAENTLLRDRMPAGWRRDQQQAQEPRAPRRHAQCGGGAEGVARRHQGPGHRLLQVQRRGGVVRLGGGRVARQGPGARPHPPPVEAQRRQPGRVAREGHLVHHG